MIVIVFAVVLLLVVVIVVTPRRRDGHGAVRDSTQLSQLFKALDTFGNQFDDTWPKPGLINTLGKEPGVGEEDFTLNTTANLYSAMIAYQFISPAVVVSPLERNPRVEVDQDYDFDAYEPLNYQYWDSNFVADLETGSNASYAHMPIYGKRGRQHWRNTLDSEWIVLGNRGPKDGKPDPRSYTTDSRGRWSGNVVFGDGHVEFFRSTTPSGVNWIDEARNLQPDNIFANETGLDLWLTFTKSISADDLVVQFD